MSDPAVRVRSLSHSYGDGADRRVALDDVSFDVAPGEIFGLLGPNGSGKTTLFRILSTLMPPPGPGGAAIAGHDLAIDRDRVRNLIGVVFQSPGLDKQLTAAENLTHQGHLYGMRGHELRDRVADALAAVGLADRAREYTSTLSGGMRRRVEIAKGLLHRPRVLLMDEPTTGLDPAARLDLWEHLRRITGGGDARDRGDAPVTVLLTTHLMEEADLCSRVGILAGGRLVACDTPAALKARVGGDVISMSTRDAAALVAALREKLGINDAQQISDGTIRLERQRGHELVPALIESAPGLVESVSVGKPTLQDVFIRLTGQRLATDDGTTLPETRGARR